MNSAQRLQLDTRSMLGNPTCSPRSSCCRASESTLPNWGKFGAPRHRDRCTVACGIPGPKRAGHAWPTISEDVDACMEQLTATVSSGKVCRRSSAARRWRSSARITSNGTCLGSPWIPSASMTLSACEPTRTTSCCWWCSTWSSALPSSEQTFSQAGPVRQRLRAGQRRLAEP